MTPAELRKLRAYLRRAGWAENRLREGTIPRIWMPTAKALNNADYPGPMVFLEKRSVVVMMWTGRAHEQRRDFGVNATAEDVAMHLAMLRLEYGV